MNCEVGVKHWHIKHSEWQQLILFCLSGSERGTVLRFSPYPNHLSACTHPGAALKRGEGCTAVPVPSSLQLDDCVSICMHPPYLLPPATEGMSVAFLKMQQHICPTVWGYPARERKAEWELSFSLHSYFFQM